VVDGSHLDKAVKAIKHEFKNGIIKEITQDSNVSVVAVVGAGMANTPWRWPGASSASWKSPRQCYHHKPGFVTAQYLIRSKRNDRSKAVQVLHKEFGLEGDK